MRNHRGPSRKQKEEEEAEWSLVEQRGSKRLGKREGKKEGLDDVKGQKKKVETRE